MINDSVDFLEGYYKRRKQTNTKDLINLKLDTALNWTNDEAVIKLIYEAKNLLATLK